MASPYVCRDDGAHLDCNAYLGLLPFAASISAMAFRYVFWFSLGLAAASFGKWGIVPVMGVIALLVVINFVLKDGKETLRIMKTALVDGAKASLRCWGCLCDCGVIIGVLTLTELRLILQDLFWKWVKKSFLFTASYDGGLFGFRYGHSTISNYIITSSIAAPALLKHLVFHSL